MRQVTKNIKNIFSMKIAAVIEKGKDGMAWYGFRL